MSKTLCMAASLAVLGGAAAGVARADTVEVRFVESGNARAITVSGVRNVTVNAGELVHQFRNGTGDAAGLSGLIRTFCTEVTQNVNSNWQVFNLTDAANAPSPGVGMGAAKAEMLAKLYDVAAGQQHQTANFAAAFQMMVWEIVYDFDPSVAGSANLSRTDGAIAFSSGGSYFGAVSSIFETLRTGVLASNGIGAVNLRAIVNGGSQDQLVMIPLPSAGLLAGAGLLGVVGVRRRRA